VSLNSPHLKTSRGSVQVIDLPLCVHELVLSLNFKMVLVFTYLRADRGDGRGSGSEGPGSGLRSAGDSRLAASRCLVLSLIVRCSGIWERDIPTRISSALTLSGRKPTTTRKEGRNSNPRISNSRHRSIQRLHSSQPLFTDTHCKPRTIHSRFWTRFVRVNIAQPLRTCGARAHTDLVEAG